jgi:excisionase family DNA binding protein
MNKPNELIEALIPLPQVAKILNMSKKTLSRRIKAGELPVVRDGNIISVMPDDLKIYLAQRRIA